MVYRFVRNNSLVIWTPLPWFLAATAVYWGFGPLLYKFGSSSEILVSNSMYNIDSSDLFRTNILNTFGTMVVIATILAIQNRIKFNRIQSSFVKAIPIYKTKQLAIGFLVVGGIIRYGFLFPYEFGLVNYTLPGAVDKLGELGTLALVILGYLSSLEGGRWRLVYMSFFTLEIFVNSLRFSKSSLLLVIILGTIGCFLGRKKIKTLVIGSISCVIVLYLYSNVVSTGRIKITTMIESRKTATLSQRFNILKEMFNEKKNPYETTKHGMWHRLNYANVQAFAMDQYDSGYPGNDFRKIFWTFIPRAIWPSKPNMTSAGLEFYTLLRNQHGTSLGITLFADAYYHGGWIMVVIVSIVVGLIFSILTRMAAIIMNNKSLIFLPCIFLGIKMGFRVDGRFVADYVGAFVIYVGYFGIIYFFMIPKKIKS